LVCNIKIGDVKVQLDLTLVKLPLAGFNCAFIRGEDLEDPDLAGYTLVVSAGNKHLELAGPRINMPVYDRLLVVVASQNPRSLGAAAEPIILALISIDQSI
jgi:hypothetical protein